MSFILVWLLYDFFLAFLGLNLRQSIPELFSTDKEGISRLLNPMARQP